MYIHIFPRKMDGASIYAAQHCTCAAQIWTVHQEADHAAIDEFQPQRAVLEMLGVYANTCMNMSIYKYIELCIVIYSYVYIYIHIVKYKLEKK